MDIGDATMVHNGTWHEAEVENAPPPDPASLPSMEGTAGTVLCQVEETQGMAKDEGELGDWNHSHWQVYYVSSDVFILPLTQFSWHQFTLTPIFRWS